jgi:tRNA (cmo5U34)-methyltransferase
VTETILKRYPQASVVWLDGSAAMQKHAEPRLAKYNQQVQMFLRDLADPAWSAELPGPFHAAVSAIALHHLTDQRKRALCAEVYELLLPGGVFLNNDVVTGAPDMREHFTPLSDRVIQQHLREQTGVEHSLEEIRGARTAMQRPKGQSSHIAALESQLDWWREAGFRMVDCYWKFLNFAIFGGIKENPE